ncbi:MAG: hypothetical protein ACREH8_06885, partial [Opitutaceae bacterium]
ASAAKRAGLPRHERRVGEHDPDRIDCGWKFLGDRLRWDFVGTLEDHTAQRHDLDHISRPVHDERDRSWRGFNFFLTEDLTVLLALLRGEFILSGLSGRRLRSVLPDKTPAQLGRILKRLRLHGLLRRVGHTYRYYLTSLGRRVLIAARKLTEHLIVPALQPTPASPPAI